MLIDMLYVDDWSSKVESMQMRLKDLIKKLRKRGFIIEVNDLRVSWQKKQLESFTVYFPQNLKAVGVLGHIHKQFKQFTRQKLEKYYHQNILPHFLDH